MGGPCYCNPLAFVLCAKKREKGEGVESDREKTTTVMGRGGGRQAESDREEKRGKVG